MSAVRPPRPADTITHERDLPRLETQETVGNWCHTNFGAPEPFAILRRQCDELLEAMEVCCLERTPEPGEIFEQIRASLKDLDPFVKTREAQMALAPQIGEELADVVIVGYHAADTLGVQLQSFVDYKMRINRKRQWTKNADGTGQHVEGT